MASIFGAPSTADAVLQGVDLTGFRILVTGVSAGIGLESARVLAAHGAWVVGAARDLGKARAATAQVGADASSRGGLELVELDLASLASVRACRVDPAKGLRPILPYLLALFVGTLLIAAIPWLSIGFLKT